MTNKNGQNQLGFYLSTLLDFCHFWFDVNEFSIHRVRTENIHEFYSLLMPDCLLLLFLFTFLLSLPAVSSCAP